MRRILFLVGLAILFTAQTFNFVPTQPPGTNNNTPASTAFVQNAVSGSGVTSFKGRTGAVTPAANDYAFSQLSGNIATSQMNNGTGASGSTAWFGDGTWKTPAGGGNVSTSGGTVTQCAQWTGSTTLGSIPCGGGGGGGFSDYINIKTYGATGDGTCRQLSSAYGSLAAAQAVYPFVSDLTQCIDWAATQQAINVAFATAPVDSSFTVYCPAGNYQLSNPLMFDQANGIQGSYSAWESGITYGNGANVTYNGIPWLSMGSGNIGNPPTSQALYPTQLQIANTGGGGNPWINQAGFPWVTVSFSNASPTTVTVFGGQTQVSANLPLVFFTQQFANPNGGSTPALPTGINANQVYYIVGSSINNTAGTFQISTTPGGGAIGSSGGGVGTFFASAQVWQVQPIGTGAPFSNRVSFVGDDGITSNGGCRFHTQYNWTTPVIFISGQNGGLIKNITVNGNAPLTDGNNVYTGARCTSPFSLTGQPTSSSPAGPSIGTAGFALMSNGGGSRTKFENTGAQLLSIGYWIGYGTNGELADSNTWEKSLANENCIGIYFGETQAFINTIYDTTGNDNDTGVVAYSQEGAKIIGGNWSAGITNSTSFAVTSVSSAAGCGFLCITATITSPDVYLQAPMCAYSAGQAYNSGARWLNAWPFASGCGYTTFVMNVPHWGLIGSYVANYVPQTGVITLAVPAAWAGIYQGACCGSDLATQLATVTTLYAAESPIAFFGDSQVDSVHIENGTPTTLSCFCTRFFGGARPAELRNVYFNAEATLTSYGCCNWTSNGISASKYLSRFYVQNVIPFINSTLGDTIIDGLSGGFNGASAATGFWRGAMDRALIATETSSYVEGRHMMGANNQNTSTGSGGNHGGPLFDFANSAIGTEWLNTTPLVNPGTLGQLSGGYYAMGGSAYGSGTWDNPSNFVSSAAYSVNGSNQMVNQADLWRSRGWGQSPYWGIRPAPWSSPCILPSQATSLGSLPAITHTGFLQDFLNVNSGGTGYTNGDTLTLVGGTGTAATVFVTGVSGGVITGVQVLTTGSYTGTFPTTFTVTGGTGTGATFNSPIWYTNYTIGYPLLWGGHIYKACNYNDASFSGPKYAIKSTHTGWSYGQNLTTTNVPNLSWTMDGASPFIYMNLEALELMFPGLFFSLTGSGGCSGTESFVVLEVHPSAGYVKVVRADNDGSNYVPALAASGTSCSGTTIGQASFSLVNPY